MPDAALVVAERLAFDNGRLTLLVWSELLADETERREALDA